MAKNFKNLRDKMTPERQKRIKKMADQEMQKIVIFQMRKFVGITKTNTGEDFEQTDTHEVLPQ